MGEGCKEQSSSSCQKTGGPISRAVQSAGPPSSATIRNETPPPDVTRFPNQYDPKKTVFRVRLDESKPRRLVPLSRCNSNAQLFARIARACKVSEECIESATVLINALEDNFEVFVVRGVDEDFDLLISQLEDYTFEGRCWLDVDLNLNTGKGETIH